MGDMKAPGHLSASTKTWWDEIARGYVLEPHHLKLLQSACEAWDRAETARRTLKRQGMFYRDRWDQPKEHPAAATERQSRDLFRRLVRELGLDVAPPNESRPPAPGANSHLRIAR